MAREVLGEFWEISGKFASELKHGRGSAIRVWLVSLRHANRTALAWWQRDKAHAASGLGAPLTGRAGAGPCHQAGTVRPGLGRDGGERRRAHVLYSRATRSPRRRRPASAHDRDPAPAWLPPHGAGPSSSPTEAMLPCHQSRPPPNRRGSSGGPPSSRSSHAPSTMYDQASVKSCSLPVSLASGRVHLPTPFW